MVTAAHQPSGSAAALSLTAELPGRRPHDLKGFMFPSTPHWLIKVCVLCRLIKSYKVLFSRRCLPALLVILQFIISLFG